MGSNNDLNSNGIYLEKVQIYTFDLLTSLDSFDISQSLDSNYSFYFDIITKLVGHPQRKGKPSMAELLGTRALTKTWCLELALGAKQSESLTGICLDCRPHLEHMLSSRNIRDRS